jgi:hypothetical protein
MTMMAIKHSAQRQKNGSENPDGREFQQLQIWLLRFTQAEQEGNKKHSIKI